MSPELQDMLQRLYSYMVDKSDMVSDPSGGHDDVPNDEMRFAVEIEGFLIGVTK